MMNRVRRDNPCPICGKPDWCLIAGDKTAAICKRIESPKQCGEAGWLHRLRDHEPGRARACCLGASGRPDHLYGHRDCKSAVRNPASRRLRRVAGPRRRVRADLRTRRRSARSAWKGSGFGQDVCRNGVRQSPAAHPPCRLTPRAARHKSESAFPLRLGRYEALLPDFRRRRRRIAGRARGCRNLGPHGG